ncbi:MAG: hypothetical protein PHE09_20575 [Oscillospiraceae bacterium]|nr:hypothetical protein [Oscillospiraceae bacterium]
MKLIDVDAFEKWLKEFYPSHLEIISGIRNAPTVDAVPVVRCGECKFFHFHPNNDFADNAGVCTENSHYCDFSKCEADRFITDFCSSGERKGNT